MMNIAFNPKNEITDPNDLFGRKILFDQLEAIANRKSNTQVIGLRRFGKTSLLKSLETYLKDSHNSKTYPIYCDFKEVGSEVKGTANVYRYALSLVIVSYSKDNLYTERESFRNQVIEPSDIWEDIYISLQEINDIRIPGLFEEVVTFFADLTEKTILFLFDEYEYLFRFTFDNPTGFMKLRNLTSKLTDEGLNPFTFFVSGSITWEELCSITGSGELNCIDQLLYVTPIDFDSFKKMWDYEVSLISDPPHDILNGSEFAYKASGGVPFYGKIIGSTWYTSKKKPSYTVLKSHLQELLNSFENEQRHILFEITKNKKTFKNTEFLLDMRDKGLIKKNNNKYEITIGFFSDYIKSLQNNYLINSKSSTQEIVDKIEELIMVINKTNENKKFGYIFLPVNEDIALFKDLRTECLSAEQFVNFSGSLYRIVFEKTKKNVMGRDKTLASLPDKFKKGNQFISIVDIMRHSLGKGHLMDTFTQRNGQMTKGEMLNILVGSKNEPIHPDDFHALQIKTLNLFEKELKILKLIVDSMQ